MLVFWRTALKPRQRRKIFSTKYYSTLVRNITLEWNEIKQLVSKMWISSFAYQFFKNIFTQSLGLMFTKKTSLTFESRLEDFEDIELISKFEIRLLRVWKRKPDIKLNKLLNRIKTIFSLNSALCMSRKRLLSLWQLLLRLQTWALNGSKRLRTARNGADGCLVWFRCHSLT